MDSPSYTQTIQLNQPTNHTDGHEGRQGSYTFNYYNHVKTFYFQLRRITYLAGATNSRQQTTTWIYLLKLMVGTLVENSTFLCPLTKIFLKEFRLMYFVILYFVFLIYFVLISNLNVIYLSISYYIKLAVGTLIYSYISNLILTKVRSTLHVNKVNDST